MFQSIGAIPHGRLRIVLGVGGSRGPGTNRCLGETLAELVAERSLAAPVRLTVTASEDSAGERDRVHKSDRAAMLAPLRLGRPAFDYEPALAAAVRRTVEGSDPGDLVLLLGAPGMDQAADLARQPLP